MECLDTTVLIDILRGKEEAKKLQSVLQGKHLFTTELNVYEVIQGIFANKKRPEHELEKADALFHTVRILPLRHAAALRGGEISGMLMRQGRTIDDFDILTASIALAHGINVVRTRDVAHFQRIPGLNAETY